VSHRTKVQVVYTKACVYCGPTKAMWKELQKNHKFEYEEIDAETAEGQKLVEKFEIMAVPATIIDGKVRFVGLPNKAKAEQIVTE
jgi:thioredoxin 1